MPLRHRLQTKLHPAAELLRRQLVEEWKAPREHAPAPIIIEEEGTQGRPTHLYVIWNDWADLNVEERSEIIMDAFEEVRGRDKVLQVTVAMGLTPEEANRMNIQY